MKPIGIANGKISAMVKYMRFLFLWMGTAALTWTFYAADEIRLAQSILAAASLWTLGLLQRWRHSALFGLVTFVLLAAIGIYRELPFGWLFAGALYAYFAYNLSRFYLRLRYLARQKQDTKSVTRVHFIRLALLMLAGLLLSSISLLLQQALDTAWIIFLLVSTLAVIGILLAWTRKDAF